MSYTVSAVLPALVELLWPMVIVHLQDAIDQSNGESTEESIRRDLNNADAILVVIYKESKIYGAAVVRERVFDTGIAAIFVGLLGGTNMVDWIDDAYSVAKAIGKDLGCTAMYCVGRDGWEKALKHIGFKKAYTVLINSIEG